MLNPFKLMIIYGDFSRMERVAKEKATMQQKVTQYLTLAISLSGVIGAPALAGNWLHAHVAVYTTLVAAAVVLHAVLPSIFAAPSASDLQATKLTGVGNETQKLGAMMLVSLLLMSTMTGCSEKQVAQDIVNWTPTIVSTANVVASTVSALAPADAAIISTFVAGFDVTAETIASQAQAYLSNPNGTLLQVLQAQVSSFQQSVNTALLKAVKITNPQSQQQIIAAIQALSVGVNAVLALIASISGNTVKAAASAVKLSQLEPLMDRRKAVAMVAAHYGESDREASAQVAWTQMKLAQAGF